MADSSNLPSADVVQQLVSQLQNAVDALDATRVRLQREHEAALTRMKTREAELDVLQNAYKEGMKRVRSMEEKLKRSTANADAAVASVGARFDQHAAKQEQRIEQVLKSSQGRLNQGLQRMNDALVKQNAAVKEASRQARADAIGAAQAATASIQQSIGVVSHRLSVVEHAARQQAQSLDATRADQEKKMAIYETRLKMARQDQEKMEGVLQTVVAEQKKPGWKKFL